MAFREIANRLGRTRLSHLWLVVAGALGACVLSDVVSVARGDDPCGSLAGVPTAVVLGFEAVALGLVVAAMFAARRVIARLGPDTGRNGIATYRRRTIAQVALVLGLLCLLRQLYRIAMMLIPGGCG